MLRSAASAFCFLILNGCSPYDPSGFTFRRMLVEYAESPANIDVIHPRFSWIISSTRRNQVQSAYRIMVASSPDGLIYNRADVWDSGKKVSGETIQHEFENDLRSDTKYYWKVICWDNEGKKHGSPISKFETALLSEDDWKANWIGQGPRSEKLTPRGFYFDRKEESGRKDTIAHNGNSLLLREEVLLPKKIRSAKAFITGLGLYEFFINGSRVGDHVLAPAKTPYHKYILYDTYDVTSLVKQGVNAFGIHLGNGWYNPYKKWWNQYRMQWFGAKKAIAQIHVTYTDGTTQIVRTDENWSWAPGPVKFNCIYDGEVYDAGMDHNGWTVSGYDESDWERVTLFSKPDAGLVSHRMPAIKVNETFKPAEVKIPVEGLKVYDMGQNFAGWVRIEAKGDKNTVMKIRFAEDIKEDGTIDVTSNEHANAIAEYIFKGNGKEIYEPRFTYFGFRYVEISSQNGPVNIINIEGRALFSDNPQTGNFECGNSLINKIHRATVWSQKSNMLGYPMDCPQRDERLGWLGDAQVTAEEAMFNFDMALFYENWFEGIRENQDQKTGDIPVISPRPYIPDEGIEWSSTYFTMLWQYYTCYGDSRILMRHYPAMKRYMSFLDSLSKDFILPMGWIGDWGSMVKGWKEGEPESVPTAFYFLDAKIMTDVASILGKEDDNKYFTRLAVNIRRKYNKTWFDTLTANYNDGSQMANSFPLFLGIVPENLEQKVLENLANDIVVKNGTHLTTGVLGTKYMPEALAMNDRAEVAWRLINQKSPPSWNNMMNRYTTTCEFWTLKQSKNHVMMGSIDAWFYKYISGITPDESHPAFASFRVKPLLPDSLGFAKARIETMRGTISSEWVIKQGIFSLKLEIPFNTTAMVYLPCRGNDVVREGGVLLGESDGIEYIGYSNGAHLLKVHSGKYLFTVDKN